MQALALRMSDHHTHNTSPHECLCCSVPTPSTHVASRNIATTMDCEAPFTLQSRYRQRVIEVCDCGLRLKTHMS